MRHRLYALLLVLPILLPIVRVAPVPCAASDCGPVYPPPSPWRPVSGERADLTAQGQGIF